MVIWARWILNKTISRYSSLKYRCSKYTAFSAIVHRRNTIERSGRKSHKARAVESRTVQLSLSPALAHDQALVTTFFRLKRPHRNRGRTHRRSDARNWKLFRSDAIRNERDAVDSPCVWKLKIEWQNLADRDRRVAIDLIGRQLGFIAIAHLNKLSIALKTVQLRPPKAAVIKWSFRRDRKIGRNWIKVKRGIGERLSKYPIFVLSRLPTIINAPCRASFYIFDRFRFLFTIR